jgi:hypothetical protein
MSFIEFDVRGADLASRLFGRTSYRLEDPRPAFRDIGVYLRGVEREQFVSHGGRSGGWAPLSPQTVRQKGSSTPLVATGALMHSLTGRGRGHRERVSKAELLFGTSVFYGRFVAKRRPIIDLNRGDARHIALILGRYIVHD